MLFCALPKGLDKAERLRQTILLGCFSLSCSTSISRTNYSFLLTENLGKGAGDVGGGGGTGERSRGRGWGKGARAGRGGGGAGTCKACTCGRVMASLSPPNLSKKSSSSAYFSLSNKFISPNSSLMLFCTGVPAKIHMQSHSNMQEHVVKYCHDSYIMQLLEA